MWGRLLWGKILEPKIGGVSMAWLAVDDDGSESLYANKSYRRTDPNYGSYWKVNGLIGFVNLPKGSIKKLIGRELSWSDEPVELKEE